VLVVVVGTVVVVGAVVVGRTVVVVGTVVVVDEVVVDPPSGTGALVGPVDTVVGAGATNAPTSSVGPPPRSVSAAPTTNAMTRATPLTSRVARSHSGAER
jgi:hypothetical protein